MNKKWISLLLIILLLFTSCRFGETDPNTGEVSETESDLYSEEASESESDLYLEETSESESDPDRGELPEPETGLYQGELPEPEPISDELKAEVDAAWTKTFREPIKWSFPRENGDRDYYVRYYGIFDGYVVIYKCDTKAVKEVTYTVGEVEITHLSGNIFAYKDGTFLLLKTVYGDGSLSEESLAGIVERHNVYEQIMREREETVRQKIKAEWPKAEPIPADVLEKMDEAWMAQRWNDGKTPISWAEKGEMFWNDGRMRHYGTFGDCIVLGNPGWSTAELSSTPRVAGGLFTVSNLIELYVYCDGQFYDLEDAYYEGLISAGDVAIASDYHKMYEAYADRMFEEFNTKQDAAD